MRPFFTAFVLALSSASLSPALASAQALYEQAIAAFEPGDYESAANGFQAILDDTPEWAPGHVALAQCRYLLGHPESAEHSLHRAVEADAGTDLFGAYMSVGQLLFKEKRYADAIAPLEHALVRAVESQRKPAQLKLGYAYYFDGRYGPAREALQRYRERYGVEAEPAYYLALSCKREGDYPCALDALEAAREAGSERPRVVEYLAVWSRYWALATENRERREPLLAAAVGRTRAWHRADPANEAALAAHAETLLAARRFDDLVRELSRLVEAGTASCVCSAWIARALNGRGDASAAEGWARRAIDCDGDSAEGHVELAAARVLQMRPSHTDVEEVRRDIDRARSALEALDVALRVDPHGESRAAALRAELATTLERLLAAERDFVERDVEVDRIRREEIRQRCLAIRWKMTHGGAVSAEERTFDEEHDCRQFRL